MPQGLIRVHLLYIFVEVFLDLYIFVNGLFFSIAKLNFCNFAHDNTLYSCIKSLENVFSNLTWDLKGALSGLREFLAFESPLKVIRSASHFTLKALFVLKIFKFLSYFVVM